MLSKRQDGFHNIQSILIPIGLYDEIDVEISDRLQFSHSGIPIPSSPSENLCVKAYRLLRNDFDIPDVKIHLQKNIPPGSGLGGGSSNAVACLKTLNQLFELHLNKSQLSAYAKELGSDCTFFVQNTIALVSGRGEKVESIAMDLQDLELMLVCPNLFISTAIAFSKVKPSKDSFPLEKVMHLPRTEWGKCIKNDFEQILFREFPFLEHVKSKLIENGAIYSSMSGSGSAVYGFFEKGKLNQIEWPSHYFVWKGKVLS